MYSPESIKVLWTHPNVDICDVELTFNCAMCGKPKSVVVKYADFERREMGEMVQDCFPYLPAAERELFVSGICGDCFKKT